jgi:hypothetical protein
VIVTIGSYECAGQPLDSLVAGSDLFAASVAKHVSTTFNKRMKYSVPHISQLQHL